MVWNAAATGRAGDAGGGQGLDRRAALALLGLGALGCRGGHDAASPVDAGAASLTLPAPAPRDGQWQRGASLGLFVSRTDAEYRRGIYETFLAEMADAGVTDVQLIVRWTARTVNDPHLVPEAPGDDDQLRTAIAAARARRMRVFLMPLVHIRERRAADWRGALAPTDWAQWWQSYAAFIEHYARLAAASEVSLLAVGSELVSAEAQVDRWRDLIARVRRLYSGRLTYSANWDHFEPVGFFDRLDVPGISVYPPLSTARSPSDGELVDGFRPFAERLRAWAARTNERYLFTEVGYPALPTAAARPWDYRAVGPVDLAMQQRCYRALFRAWHADPRLAGVYLWNWFGPGGPADPGYSPRGKPALQVIRRWYMGSRARSKEPR